MKKIIYFMLLISITSIARADLLLEPLVGYSFGTGKEGVLPDDGFKLNGGSFGGRVGYQNLGLQLGLDYLNSTLNVEDTSEDLKLSEWAGFIGYKFPMFFRIYAGYLFAGSGELGNATLEKLSGTKFGLGFTGFPFININLEMRNGSFDEYKFGSFTVKETTKYQAYMLSISLPFTI